MAAMVAMNGRWSTGSCDCCAAPGGCGLCCLTCCCPMITYGQNVAMLNPEEAPCGGNCFLAGLGFYCLSVWSQIITTMTALPVPQLSFIVHMQARTAIRNRYNLPPAPCPDCLWTCCCPCCALIQENNELILRGAHITKLQPGAPAMQIPNQMYGQPAQYGQQPVQGYPQAHPQGGVPVAQPVGYPAQ